jgi:hypothetical protein
LDDEDGRGRSTASLVKKKIIEKESNQLVSYVLVRDEAVW